MTPLAFITNGLGGDRTDLFLCGFEFADQTGNLPLITGGFGGDLLGFITGGFSGAPIIIPIHGLCIKVIAARPAAIICSGKSASIEVTTHECR